MSWFNYYGLIFIVIIMIPNIVFAVKNGEGYKNIYQNKAAYISEQIGRYACMAFMVFNIPYTYKGFYFPYAETVYISVNSVSVLCYCVIWIVFWRKTGVLKALLLSVIPSFVFIFSSAVTGSIPLAVSAVVFAVSHILISVKNVHGETSRK